VAAYSHPRLVEAYKNGAPKSSFSHLFCCALTINTVVETTGKRVLQLADDIAASSKEKIRLILRIGLLHGHDSLVLRYTIAMMEHMMHSPDTQPKNTSAFGCGAFCNPPYHIAQLFWEVIEHQFFHSFKHICFAIFGAYLTSPFLLSFELITKKILYR